MNDSKPIAEREGSGAENVWTLRLPDKNPPIGSQPDRSASG